MRQIIDLIRCETRARIFAIALTQSSLGTGAGYIALLILALDRLDSPWAISAVLLADLIPAMLLGPVFGAIADRWSRRTCMVFADVIRAVAFIGIAVAPTFEMTVALAALAGVGTGLFGPAALASLPSLVEERRLPAAISLYGAIADLGFFAGPAVAGAVLLFGSAESLMLGNGITFAVSAVLLTGLSYGAAPVREGAGVAREAASSLLTETREGLRVAAGLGGIRAVLLASGAAMFFVGILNVAELPFAIDDLGTTEAGYSMLAAVLGLGFIGGSVAGAKGGELPELKRRYLLGLLLMAVGLVSTALAPGLPIALATFALFGFGNGLLLVYERLLIQRVVPDRLAGRVFGVKDSLTAWSFGLAFVGAAAVLVLLGPRTLLLIAGGGGVAVWLLAAQGMRDTWTEQAKPRHLGHRPDPAVGRLAGKDRADAITGGNHWLTLLDDLDQPRHDLGVELGAGVGHQLT